MGEATYCLKAKYATAEAADTACQSFADFVRQGQEAERFWQQNRATSEEFWGVFVERFPRVAEYLEQDCWEAGCKRQGADQSLRYVGGDHNNALAGLLDFGMDEEEPRVDGDGTEVWFAAYVWHFADWDGLAGWLKRVTGATAVEWVSDEYLDPFDAIHV